MDDSEMNELNQLFSMFTHIDQELVKDVYFGTSKKFEDALDMLVEYQGAEDEEEE